MTATMDRAHLRKRAQELYKTGRRKADIARELGVDPSTVQVWIVPDHIAADEALVEKMRRLHADGVPHAHIARQLGVNRAMVTAAVGAAEPPETHSNETKVHVLGSAETFAKIKAIAKSFGAVTYQGRGAGNGSIAVLLKWIADGRLVIRRANERESGHAAHRE